MYDPKLCGCDSGVCVFGGGSVWCMGWVGGGMCVCVRGGSVEWRGCIKKRGHVCVCGRGLCESEVVCVCVGGGGGGA